VTAEATASPRSPAATPCPTAASPNALAAALSLPTPGVAAVMALLD